MLRRRDLGRAALAFGAATLLTPTLGAAQGPLERLKGDITDVKEDVREEVAYVYGIDAYIYGFPLVIMDLTRQVATATPTEVVKLSV
jgi:hypothetical protein